MESADVLTKIVLPLLIFVPSLPSIISLLTFGYKLGHGKDAYKVKVVETETVRRIEGIENKYSRENVEMLLKGKDLFEKKALLISRIKEREYKKEFVLKFSSLIVGAILPELFVLVYFGAKNILSVDEQTIIIIVISILLSISFYLISNALCAVFQSSGTASDYADEYELELINEILKWHIEERVKGLEEGSRRPQRGKRC